MWLRQSLWRIFLPRPTSYPFRGDHSFTVCVEGNIGSGKTTCLEYFKKFSDKIEVNGEPVDRWREFQGYRPLLQLYTSPERWAFTVQSFIMLTMIQAHKKPQTKPVRLMERSVYSSRYCFVENLYKNKLMTDLEYVMLSRIFDWSVNKEEIKIDLIVYLQTKPEVVYDRIMARHRPEEHAIQLKYLQDLHSFHEAWLIEKKTFEVPAPVLVVDGNKDKSSMLQTYHDLKSQILFSQDTNIT